MKPIPHVKPGDPISASLYNAVAERLEEKLALTVAPGCGLTMERTPNGRVLMLNVPRPVWAQLSGTGNPYSWQEVEPTSGGGWSVFGQRAGTSNAYEINGKSGLSGKVVDLWKTSAGDWRFVWEGVGGTPCTSGNVCGVVTSDGCGSGGTVEGATVTVKDNSGTTVGTCTTDATGKCCVAIPKSGTYTATCDVPGASQLSGSVSASCGVDNNVDFAFPANSLGTVCFSCHTCDCTGNTAVSGATISITGAGTASATTDASGAACLKLGVGSYSATITYPSGFTHTQAFSVSACATTNISVTSSTGVYISGTGQAGCSGSITITDTTLSTTIGTGTLTFDGTGNGSACVAITETLVGDLFVVKIVFPKFTDNGGSAPLACYTSSSPYAVAYVPALC